ncbi:prepilin-type N-terminal cleavage/methylation domain-containing protein [Arcobacter sp. LA11]|uniref:prepilin-type N-terminal cleavage/methylation domain-containing protein n=1 Tax=Arcobacter sp. LA11 TaxID=1898176 RepID=UPI000932E270|nr:prepilin-type N-terminal cleavage/methylation domain-containing protein [Arcobacter sp. LA11]
MKKAFSLLELIFAIVIIGIIASFAIPKYMNSRDSALASTIKRDIVTTTTSIQSYYLVNRKLDKISDAITLNTANWVLTDKKISFLDNGTNCIDLEVKESSVLIKIIKDAGNVCKALDELGVRNLDIDLI